jgi:hypothetical protein
VLTFTIIGIMFLIWVFNTRRREQDIDADRGAIVFFGRLLEKFSPSDLRKTFYDEVMEEEQKYIVRYGKFPLYSHLPGDHEYEKAQVLRERLKKGLRVWPSQKEFLSRYEAEEALLVRLREAGNWRIRMILESGKDYGEKWDIVRRKYAVSSSPPS